MCKLEDNERPEFKKGRIKKGIFNGACSSYARGLIEYAAAFADAFCNIDCMLCIDAECIFPGTKKDGRSSERRGK